MSLEPLHIAEFINGREPKPFLSGDLAFLPLTRGLWTVVDAQDFDQVNDGKWTAHPSRSANSIRWYANRRLVIGGRTRSVMMHRVLMGAPRGLDVDHENGDSLDNRRGNLRACTRSDNHCNRRYRLGSSGYRGVVWHKESGTWQVHVSKDKVVYSGGYFHDVVEAARHRDRMALKHHGEFAILNFPRAA